MNIQSNQLEPELATMQSLLTDVRPLIDGFVVREEHFAADLVMLGNALAAWDCAKSTEALLLASDLTVGAFVCARAAFEAAEDAALLASDPSYDDTGASARVFEAFEYALERSRWGKAFPENSTAFPDPEFSLTVQQAEEFAAKLDRHHPGSGDRVRAAVARWLPPFQRAMSGKPAPLHWAGVGRKRIAQLIADRRGNPDQSKQLTSVYSMLSRYAHPRARLETWERTTDPSAQSLYRSSDVNRLRSAQAVVVSMILLRDALVGLSPT